MDFVLSLFLTLFVCLLVPIILCITKPLISLKVAKIIAIANGVVSFIIFSIIGFVTESGVASPAPCFLWSIVGYYIIKRSCALPDTVESDNQPIFNIQNALSISLLPENSNNPFFSYNGNKYDKAKFINICFENYKTRPCQELLDRITSLENFINAGNKEEFYAIHLEALFKALSTTYPDELNKQHDEPLTKKSEEPKIKEELPETEELEPIPSAPIQETETKQIPPVETANRFCQYCGQPIDKLSKRCMGCGRKYFFVR